jgi:hypothetical protein
MKQPANMDSGCEHTEKAVVDWPVGECLARFSSDLPKHWGSNCAALSYPPWTFLSESAPKLVTNEGQFFRGGGEGSKI